MTTKLSSHSEYQLIHALLSGSDIAPALAKNLQKCVQNAVELFALEDCGIALFDAERARLIALATSQGESAAWQSDLFTFALPEGLWAKLVESCEPLVLSNVALNASMQPSAGGAPRSLAYLPLVAQEQMLGVLTASSGTPAAFTSEKMRFLSLLAEQAALVIINACQMELVHNADHMKARFLSLVTHELRSPLNTINGYLDLALADMAGELNEQQKEFIQRARAGSEHLYALIEDLLLTARTEAGQLRLNREFISLEAVVTDMLETLELTIQDAGVTLEIALPAQLPVLFVDVIRMQQVLRNLLRNALHFTPPGGRVIIEAHLLATPGQKMIEVRVQDTGCGIAPEYHERIFEPFVQAPRSDGGRTSGQGLGLTVVRTIVELHGGRVRVESVVGEGSTFLFTLDALKGPPR